MNKPISDLLTIEPKDIATAAVQFLYDKDHLYALWIVKDSALSADATDDWAQDSVELFLDQNRKGTNIDEDDDAQYRVNYEGKLSGQGAGYDESDLEAAVVKTDIGYIVEMAIEVNKAELKRGAKLGLELQVNDDHDSGTRDAIAPSRAFFVHAGSGMNTSMNPRQCWRPRTECPSRRTWPAFLPSALV